MRRNSSNLPPGWVLATVDQVGTVQLGLMKSPDRNTGIGRTKYLRAANIGANRLNLDDVSEMDFTAEEREAFALIPGDVLLAEASGSAEQVGRAAIWHGEIPDCCYQKTIIRFRPHAVIPEFALLVFRSLSISGAFANTARGVGIQHLTAERFARLPFPVPPMEEQRQISAEAERRLGELNQGAADMRSALSRVDEQVREILATAVSGALVPTEAQLAAAEGRSFTPARAILDEFRATREPQTSLLPKTFRPDGEKAHPSASADVTLPKGWTWSVINDVGELRLGRQLSPEQRQGTNLRKYLRVANVLEDRLDLSDVKEMNFTPEEFKVYRLRPGDVLLNEGQSLELVGRAALYRGEPANTCFQNTLIRFRAAPGVDPEYALLVFRCYLRNGAFRRIANRSTNIAHLGLSRLREMQFPLPPTAEQTRIVLEARRRLDASAAQQQAIRAALTGLEDMEREIVRAAVAGQLVPSSEADEPAAVLLQRLGPPPVSARKGPRKHKVNQGGGVPKEAGTKRGSVRTSSVQRRPLDEVLREAGRSMPVPELFARAGYDRDSTEAIEQFYLALRGALGTKIRAAERGGENALVELIDAP